MNDPITERGNGYEAPTPREMADAAVTSLFRTRRARLVAERRKALGLSQGQLARAADIDQSAVSSIERGRIELTTRTAARLADALDMPVESLLVGVDLVKAGLDFEVARAVPKAAS